MKSADEIITPLRAKIGLGVMLFIAFFGPATGLQTFIYRDFGVLAWPTAAYHHEMFWRGELPLWNPYSNCGVPFLAQWGTMALYPFSLIYLLLPLPWSLNFFCLAHLWLGGVGGFYLARKWSGSTPGGAMASVLFVFNGITLASLFWPNYTVAFGWMPWIIYFFGARKVLLATLTGAMQMLSGVPELIVLTWLIVGLFWIWDGIKERTFWWKGFGIIFLVTGLSAMQLLPFFELLSLSQRQAGVAATKWALPFSALGNFALPMLHAFKTPQGTWYQYDQHFLSSTYLGLPAIALALLGVWAGGPRARILGALSLICVALALGPNLPMFALLQKLPLIGLARYPVKFLLALALAVPVLAALGVAALAKKKSEPTHVGCYEKEFVTLAVTLVLLSCGLIYWVKARPFQFDNWEATYTNSVIRLGVFVAVAHLLVRYWKTARAESFLIVLLLVFVDGRFHLNNQNPTVESSALRAGIQERGLPKLGRGRVFISPEAEEHLLKSGVPDLKADFIGKQLAVWSHLNLVELVPKANGSATLTLKNEREVQDWLYSKTNVNREAWLDFLGVTRISSPTSVVEWVSRPNALPLLHLVSEVEEERDQLNFITSTSFDPRRSVAINWISDPPLRRQSEGTLNVLRFGEHEIFAEANLRTNGMAVLAQSWDPNWKVEVNGEKLWDYGIFQANHGFIAFQLPPGKSSIRIVYRNRLFAFGTIISLASLAACCWLLRLERAD